MNFYNSHFGEWPVGGVGVGWRNKPTQLWFLWGLVGGMGSGAELSYGAFVSKAHPNTPNRPQEHLEWVGEKTIHMFQAESGWREMVVVVRQG